MKILVVGGGGREHAIIRALKKSPLCTEIWCAPGNGGISYDAHCKAIPATDVDAMVKFAKEEAFDYVVVAQDDPLALGMVDALAAVGIPAFGPDKAAARIEASKVFSKDLMKKYGIPTAKYETFDDPEKVMDYIKAEGKYPVVIKADGLALGKGVLICQNEQEAADGVKEIMLDKKFGASGNHVVVEEFLTGPEVSVLSFCDGKTVKPMVSSMDHKRALDHDALDVDAFGAEPEVLFGHSVGDADRVVDVAQIGGHEPVVVLDAVNGVGARSRGAGADRGLGPVDRGADERVVVGVGDDAVQFLGRDVRREAQQGEK